LGAISFFKIRSPARRANPRTTIRVAGHFLQEDKGEEFAHIVVDFIAKTPARLW